MGRTPDEFPGLRYDEGVVITDEGQAPTQIGEVRFLSGSFIMSDSLGLFNPRPYGSSTGSLNEAQHEFLATLDHFEVNSTYDQVNYAGNPPRILNVITWDSQAMNLKVRETRFSYTGRRVTEIIDVQYVTGALKYSLTESVSYVDPFRYYVSNITRVRN